MSKKELKNNADNRISRIRFLKDVFICSLGAYGGPEAHYGVFTDQMVTRRGYLSEEELVELIALCSILPGPTSTQTIVSIGYKMGGPMLAFLTMLTWAFPVLTVMTGLSFVYEILKSMNISTDGLRYIGPMAVGFIIVAAYRISKKVMTFRTRYKTEIIHFKIHVGIENTRSYFFVAISVLGTCMLNPSLNL